MTGAAGGHGGAARVRLRHPGPLSRSLGDPQRRRRAVDLPAACRRTRCGCWRASCCGSPTGSRCAALEHLAAAGERVVIVPNHVSYLDGPLIAAFLPGWPMFAIDTAQARALVGAAAARRRPTSSRWTRPGRWRPSRWSRRCASGRQCVIFPEGRLNVTGGALMKVYDGPAMIADKGDAPVLPVRIDGVEFTPFSRLARQAAAAALVPEGDDHPATSRAGWRSRPSCAAGRAGTAPGWCSTTSCRT